MPKRKLHITLPTYSTLEEPIKSSGYNILFDLQSIIIIYANVYKENVAAEPQHDSILSKRSQLHTFGYRVTGYAQQQH